MMRISEKNKRKLQSKSKKWLIDIFIYSILIGIIFLIYFPIIQNLADMFKSASDLRDSSVAFIPKDPTLERLGQTIKEMDYWSAFRDTGLLSLGIGLLQTITCTMIGYGFARFNFPLKKFFFAMVIFSMVVPTQLLLSSYYLTFLDIDFFGIITALFGSPIRLINTPWPMFILALFGLGFKNGLFIYLIRQFFINLPKELDESGKIDGAGFLRIFFQIMLPNAMPILVTVFLFGFSWQWTDQLMTSMFMPNHPFFSLVLSSMSSSLTLKGYDPLVAASMVTTGVLLVLLPLLILYLFLQKFFVEGIERSGLVG